MTVTIELQSNSARDFSLLWPPGTRPASPPSTLPANWVVDLDLDATIRQMCEEPGTQGYVRDILVQLCQDPKVIGYRQAVLDDILHIPALGDSLRKVLPTIATLTRYHAPREKGALLHEVTWRLGELEAFVNCIQIFGDLFDNTQIEPRSEGFALLRAIVVETRQDETFQSLVQELPDLLSRIRGIASVTIGVNLDENLQPHEALLVSVNRQRFNASPFALLRRLFGQGSDPDKGSGIAPLHKLDHGGASGRSDNPMLVPLFRDLSEILDRICRPIASALQKYVGVRSGYLVAISQELGFYLGAVKLIRTIEGSGLSHCQPRLASAEERICTLRDSFNLNLALRMIAADESGGRNAPVVCNDVSFDPHSGIFILTGPNRGGKTTYMQAVGLAQVLGQAGLHVPGREAVLSPVDWIYTHFPSGERPELGAGKLGEEAARLNDIFHHATPQSLILLNESLANTSPHESFLLARDVVKALKVLQARTIYATHLHELAAAGERMNDEIPDGRRIVSVVALMEGKPGMEGTQPSFKIVPGSPTGDSHAREIASRYGISYEQLAETLRRRGFIP